MSESARYTTTAMLFFSASAIAAEPMPSMYFNNDTQLFFNPGQHRSPPLVLAFPEYADWKLTIEYTDEDMKRIARDPKSPDRAIMILILEVLRLRKQASACTPSYHPPKEAP